MTEMEERLAQLDGSELRDHLVKQLKEMEMRLRRPALLPRPQYLQAVALADAAEAAQQILTAWRAGPPAPQSN
ncbi:MAG: hypothetical protein ABIR26_13675 [Ramlibacter sp.]